MSRNVPIGKEGTKKNPDLRPLTGRALKSVIDTLRFRLPGTKVLDLYAGLGRFGIAALSHHAEEGVFVEKDRSLAKRLRIETRQWEERCTVYAQDVFSFLRRVTKEEITYDIVFADPPYRLWCGRFAERLFQAACPVLAPEGIFLVRYPKKVLVSFAVESVRQWKRSDFGDSYILYLRADAKNEGHNG